MSKVNLETFYFERFVPASGLIIFLGLHKNCSNNHLSILTQRCFIFDINHSLSHEKVLEKSTRTQNVKCGPNLNFSQITYT